MTSEAKGGDKVISEVDDLVGAPALPHNLSELIDAVKDTDRQEQRQEIQTRWAEIEVEMGRLSLEQVNLEAGLVELATDEALKEHTAKKALYEAFVKNELTQEQIETAVRILFGDDISDTVESLRELDDVVLIVEKPFNEHEYQAVTLYDVRIGVKAYSDHNHANIQYVPSCVIYVKADSEDKAKKYELTQEEVIKRIISNVEVAAESLEFHSHPGGHGPYATDTINYFLLLDVAKKCFPEIEARVRSSTVTETNYLVQFFADIKNDNELSGLRIDHLLSDYQASTIKNLYNCLVQVKPERAKQLEDLIALYAAGSFSNSGRFRDNDDAMRWARFWIKNDNPDISESEFVTLVLDKYEEYVQKGLALRQQANSKEV